MFGRDGHLQRRLPGSAHCEAGSTSRPGMTRHQRDVGLDGAVNEQTSATRNARRVTNLTNCPASPNWGSESADLQGFLVTLRGSACD